MSNGQADCIPVPCQDEEYQIAIGEPWSDQQIKNYYIDRYSLSESVVQEIVTYFVDENGEVFQK